MRILASQMAHLARRSVREFTLRMRDYLREAYPADTAPFDDAGLEAWVDRNIQRAGKHAIDTEPEVAQYLLLALLLGEDAPDRLPWFRAPLEDRRLIAPGKARALVRAARKAAIADLDRFVMQTFAT